MRSLMLALGACLVAFNFAGCSSTGSCGCGVSCNAPLNDACGGGCDSGCSDYSAQASTADCGCGQAACSGGCNGPRFGGSSGLGLSLMEAGPACKRASCNGGCETCQRARLRDRLKNKRPSLLSRIGKRDCGCGQDDCGCDEAPALDCGCQSAPAPSVDSEGCGCGCETAAVETSFGDDVSDCGCGGGECDGGCGDVQTVGFQDRGLLGKLGFGRKLGSKIRSSVGCGNGGCGIGGKLCNRCRGGLGSRVGGGGLGSRVGGGCGINGCGGAGGLCRGCLAGLGRGSIPHRQPQGGPGGAGAAGQVPTYAYPYYTTRAPRDFLDPNPPTIGY